MPPDWEAYQEAYKRGILPDDKKALYEEALGRGLVPGTQVQPQQSLLESVGQGLKSFAKGTVEQLPMLGMLGGGAAGTVLGAGPWGTVAGAAGGGGIGTGLKNIIQSAAGWEEQKPPINQVYDIAKGTLEGATAEAGGAVVGKGLDLALQGAKTVTQGARDLLKEGFPLTRGTAVENLAQKIPPGSWFFKKWGNQLNELSNNVENQFLEGLNLPRPSMKASTQAEEQKLWDTMETLAGGPTSQHKVPELYDFAADNLKVITAINKKEGALFGKLVDQVEKNGTVNYETLQDINKNLSSLWRDKKVWSQAKEAIQSDLTGIGEATGNPQIPDIYGNAMGFAKDIKDMPKFTFLENLFKRNNATITINNGQTKVMNWDQFQKNVNDNLGTLQAMFSDKPEVVDATKALADKMVNASSDISRWAKGQGKINPIEAGIGTILGGGQVSAAAFGVPTTNIAMTVPWGFETMMAKSLANPQGWLKRFLFREGGGVIPQLGALGAKQTMMNIPVVPSGEELMP
jgi:hypothetical protein